MPSACQALPYLTPLAPCLHPIAASSGSRTCPLDVSLLFSGRLGCYHCPVQPKFSWFHKYRHPPILASSIPAPTHEILGDHLQARHGPQHARVLLVQRVAARGATAEATTEAGAVGVCKYYSSRGLKSRDGFKLDLGVTCESVHFGFRQERGQTPCRILGRLTRDDYSFGRRAR